jgi:hypothetical protein
LLIASLGIALLWAATRRFFRPFSALDIACARSSLFRLFQLSSVPAFFSCG